MAIFLRVGKVYQPSVSFANHRAAVHKTQVLHIWVLPQSLSLRNGFASLLLLLHTVFACLALL